MSSSSAGLLCYVVSVAVWLLVLSRVEVSFAYPLLSVGYIVNAVAGYYLFQENLSLTAHHRDPDHLRGRVFCDEKLN